MEVTYLLNAAWRAIRECVKVPCFGPDNVSPQPLQLAQLFVTDGGRASSGKRVTKARHAI